MRLGRPPLLLLEDVYMAKTGKALKRTQAKSKEKMNKLTALFVVGVLLETYLLVVDQFYTRGTGAQMLTMSNVLVGVGLAGVATAVVGAALHWKKGELHSWGVYIAGSGVLLALTSLLCLKVNTSAAGMLSVAVPAVLLLAVVYTLYVSDFFWLAVSLAVSLGEVWYWRRCAAVQYLRLSAIVLLVLALAVVAAIAVLTVRAAKSKGVVTLGERRIRLLERDSKPALPLALHAVCAAVMLAAVLSSAAALYGFLLLAVILFAAAVYYTVAAL